MDQNTNNKPSPWLIAAWPGMGNVAVIAAGYLVHKLGMTQVAELPSREHFDISDVEIKDGIVAPARLPRGAFFRWSNPGGGRDLLVFLGEAQPTAGVYAYANELLEMATGLGAERVVTFASIASGLHPAENPRVLGVTTDADTMAELRRAEVEPLTEGQVGGLNGVLLAAAVERGIPGLCLLAEIPFFAASVPNPKAARAALSVFSVLAGIDVSLEQLNRHAAVIDSALIKAVEDYQRRQAGPRSGEGGEGEEGEEEFAAEEADGEASSDEAGDEASDEAAEVGDAPVAGASDGPDAASKPGFADRRRIEQLFEEARAEPRRALALKEELDRLGVFKLYEDRFLDLFRRAA
jgi:proteasome assembly chaperone (PAC2) family protein